MHGGLLACRNWQMSFWCASSAGVSNSSSINSWCELCDSVNLPACCLGGRVHSSSSGFKINQSGMWLLGPKAFIHTVEKAFWSLHCKYKDVFFVLYYSSFCETWLFPTYWSSYVSEGDIEGDWYKKNQHISSISIFFVCCVTLVVLSTHTWNSSLCDVDLSSDFP